MKAKGYRKKSRSILSKSKDKGGFPPIQRWLAEFKQGDKVAVDIWPGIYEGMPHSRYQGRVATVIEKRGRCYVVGIPLAGRTVKLTASPVHLRSLARGERIMKLIDKKEITIPEAEEYFSRIAVTTSYEEAVLQKYLSDFSKLSASDARDLVQKIVSKGVSLPTAVSIANCLPRSRDELLPFLAHEQSISPLERLGDIFSVVEPYISRSIPRSASQKGGSAKQEDSNKNEQ
ncbi:MAG: 50S ribosomal protein L21e [TACK group archaeon]|nr:50S ribosomal protein L21e [TACK group archaeon]